MQITLKGATTGASEYARSCKDAVKEFIVACYQAIQNNELGEKIINGGENIIMAIYLFNPRESFRRFVDFIFNEGISDSFFLSL